MFRVAKNFYLGVDASFNYIEGKDFSDVGYLRGKLPVISIPAWEAT